MTTPLNYEEMFEISHKAEYASVRPTLLAKIYAEIYSVENNLYSYEVTSGLLRTVRFYKQRNAVKYESLKDQNEPTKDATWFRFIEKLSTAYATAVPSIVEHLDALIADANKGNVPDYMSFSVYDMMPKALDGFPKALKSEIKYVAEARDVSSEDAEIMFYELRDSFATDPKNSDYLRIMSSWVGTGMERMKGFKFYYMPHDPAILYALYRMRTDYSMFPEASMNIVSIDIETAGPQGKDGFIPSNGRIIEIGMIEYTPEGKEVARYEALIKPDDEFLEKFGTGAQHIHNISVEDLVGKPSWDEVSAEILEFLRGKKMLAQNASFERNWLHNLLPGFTELNMPTVDTLEMSEKFLRGMINNKLETICTAVGVDYTNGHRALHDALVTARAYFKILARISTKW